jgi:hypothetical protein
MIDEKFQSVKEAALLIANIIARDSSSSDKELIEGAVHIDS